MGGERARPTLARAPAALRAHRPLADFDWRWPAQCDQAAIAELMTLGFLETATNAILFDLASGTPLLWDEQRVQIGIRAADS